jgi:GDPmannose 4,6-dehydratase
MEKILIFGGTGQIGSYLTELALEKGCEVHCLIRRSSSFNTGRIDHLYNNPEIGYKTLHLHYGDLSDSNSINQIINKVEPNKIFNLGAQSHVKISFDIPEYTSDIVALGVMRILEAIRNNNPKIKFLQMSSSEMFGGISGMTQLNEESNFHPRSPYGVSKLFGYWATVNYREAYNMFCSNSITFNTESIRRTENFVTRKITKGIANILSGKQEYIPMGNVLAYRDWTHAIDTVQGLWSILEHDVADDFVLGSDETHSIKEFIELAFKVANIDIEWEGSGINEIAVDTKTGKAVVKIDERFFRPSEVDILYSDSTRARTLLNWQPKTSFPELVHIMMKHDLELAGIQS